jgi:hypothetical protein
LATAYAATAPNGEIYVLDPANYGSLTITGPVSIEGHGWAAIAPVSGSAAITINANPGDIINIVGVVLDGTAIANTNGIQFNSGSPPGPAVDHAAWAVTVDRKRASMGTEWWQSRTELWQQLSWMAT